MAKSKETAPKNAVKHPNAIGIKESIGYTFGDIGNLLVLTFISTFLKVFYTDSLMVGFDSDKVYDDITVLFLVTRLWDTINDPLWGLLVDAKRPTKEGKFRPYLKWLSIPLCVSMAVCFLGINKFINSYVVILIFAYITYTCFGMLYTGVNIPYGSLASVITDDPKGRTLLSTFRSIGGGVGGAVVTLLGQMVVYDKVFDPQKNETNSVFNGDKAFVFAVILAALAVVSYLSCFKTTKERVRVPDEKKTINLKRTYGPLFRSLPFITVTVSGILISGLLQYGSFNQYLFKNYFGNSDLSIINTLCTYAPMAIMIPVMPKLVEKFGKKEICVFGLFLSSAASIFNAIFLPNVTTYFIMQALTGFGYSFMSITNWAIVMDVIDYNEYTTGEHSESAIYAVYTFSRKLGQTIADSGGMQLLKRTGYTDEYKGQHLKTVGGYGHNIYRMCTIVPAIVYTLILILTILYPLSKKKLEPIRAALTERRAKVEYKLEEIEKA